MKIYSRCMLLSYVNPLYKNFAEVLNLRVIKFPNISENKVLANYSELTVSQIDGFFLWLALLTYAVSKGVSVFLWLFWRRSLTIESPHDKTNKMACAPSEDSDQPGHPPSLIRVFAVHNKKDWVLRYPLSAQWRLIRLGGCPGWSESLLGAKSFCWFCHEAAQISVAQVWLEGGLILSYCYTIRGTTKLTKWGVTSRETQIGLHSHTVWSKSSLSTWSTGFLATHGVLFCLCWCLTSQSTIFQSCRDGATASWVINQYFRGVKCLAQGHNMAAVGIEPRTSRSGVRHSTTEPPRSPLPMEFPVKTDKTVQMWRLIRVLLVTCDLVGFCPALAMKSTAWHDFIVDWAIKPQHKQTKSSDILE